MFCNYNLFLLENDFNPSFYTRLSEITSALKNLGLKLLHVILQGKAFIQAFLSTAVFPQRFSFFTILLSSVASWCGSMVDSEGKFFEI